MATRSLLSPVCFFLSSLLLMVRAVPITASTFEPKCIMYLTGQHPNPPTDPSLLKDLTHVALAFIRPHIFNDPHPTSWPFYTTVAAERPKFAEGTKIMIAIGGWGDTQGFSDGARTEEGRKLFAKNIGRMVEETGADGVDIDWEYPGGNGEDYKTVPNSEKAWEITAYPLLLQEIRAAIGPSKLISAAVPGLPRDMLAFTSTTIPSIMSSVDFLNIMTYDMFNRRDNVTKHHTGLQLSLEAIDAYLDRGVPPEKANLGFAYYTKWYRTLPNSSCSSNPIGCPTELMENPLTGGDLGKAGAFSWHDSVPADFAVSWSKALAYGQYDEEGGGHYYWDGDENLWWTWDTPDAILKKYPRIVEERKLGGVFAWGLGEDGDRYEHLQATTKGYREWVEECEEDRGMRVQKRREL
ncbi:glycoside hydrolase family 18 protein [Amniculicola lignicola CBS 123094]|uniref:chitinase n=1 Tax=Amniculicola lignicola CBS 123094 TaxID=1392246 RepID=A0A6A5WAD7_9PLEO|nr:glycoside hydrolase family 18 protein [Amniculicola lignicola CBS 123094]